MNASPPQEAYPGRPITTPNDLVGTVVADRYQISRLIGDGGMARIYLAEHVHLRRKVAIKVLRQRLCDDPASIDRFLREARAATKISHDNIVDMFDFGQIPGGSVFIAMEYLEGEDLEVLLQRERMLSWERVRTIALQVVRALKAAHAAGIVHRDLKPSNIFVIRHPDRSDAIKVIDFGIAKMDGDRGTSITETGAVFGTARYMAPEQARGERADPRTDVYALGVVLYEMICGEAPFAGTGLFDVLHKHLLEPPRPLRQIRSNLDLPPAAETLILRMLAKAREDRPQSMADCERLLEQITLFPGLGLATASSTHDRTILIDAQGASASQAQVPPGLSGGTVVLDGMGGDMLPLAPGSQPNTQPRMPTPGFAETGSNGKPPPGPTFSTRSHEEGFATAVSPINGLVITLGVAVCSLLVLVGWLALRSPNASHEQAIKQAALPQTGAVEVAPEKVEVPPPVMPPQTPLDKPSVDTSTPAQNDETPPAATAVPDPPRAERDNSRIKSKKSTGNNGMRQALSQARAAAKQCGSLATVHVEIHLEPDGSVAAARAKPPFDRGSIGKCVEAAIKRTRFPAFEGDAIHVHVETFELQ